MEIGKADADGDELRHAARQMSSPGKKLKVGLAAARSASDHGRKSGGSKT
jgi:hypothetical protein